jgi:hypothetical protein
MTILNRIFLGSSIAIAVLDVALATQASSPGLFIVGLVLSLIAVALTLRQRQTDVRAETAHAESAASSVSSSSTSQRVIST